VPFVFLLALFSYFFYKEKTDRCLIVLVGLFTCILHVLVLPNHSFEHSFSALKFFFTIALSLFGVLPLVLLDNQSYLSETGKRIIAGGLFAIC